MAREISFEDMSTADWPVGLRNLHEAAQGAYQAYAALDYLEGKAANDRGELLDLAGRAWVLLRDLRALGRAKIAEMTTPGGDRAMRGWPGEPQDA